MRSVWKGLFFSDNIVGIGKNSVVINKLVGKKLGLYNGKSFELINIKREMIGFKLGEFVFSRKVGATHRKKKSKVVAGKKKK